jgi:glycosyltransferase involved in cell wall biosynthesis
MAHKTSIAQLAAYYPPHLGGLEMVAQQISRLLAQRGYRITVLTSNIGAKNFSEENANSNYRVHRMSSWEVAHTPVIWRLPFQLMALPPKTILHIHIAQAGLPEIAFLIAKLKKFPLIAHFHLDVGPSGRLGRLFLLYKRYCLGPILRRMDKIIVFSKEQSELIKAKYGIKEERIVIIPNGVGDEFFSTAPRKMPHHPLRLLYVGRLDAQKRVDHLIQAMAMLTIPARLVIVGDGERRDALEKLADELKLKNISFEGRKNSDELVTYYHNSDIYLTASDREGMSLVALEAMASGLPMIGSDVIGTRELFKGVGLLVREPYAENFASAITNLWNKHAEFENLSRQSIAKAKIYSWNTLIDKLEAAYREISP